MAQEEVKVGGGSMAGIPSLFNEQLAVFSFGHYPKDMHLEVLLLCMGEEAVDTTCVFNELLAKAKNARIDVGVGRKDGQYLVMCTEYGSNIALHPVKASVPVTFYPLPAPKGRVGRTVYIGLFMEEDIGTKGLEKLLPVNDLSESSGQKLARSLSKEASGYFLLTYKLSEP